MSNVFLSSFAVVAIKTNVVNLTLDDVSGCDRVWSVVRFVFEYSLERDDGCSELEVVSRLVVPPEFSAVDGNSGISVVNVAEEIFFNILVSSLVDSVVLGVDIILACTVLFATINRK